MKPMLGPMIGALVALSLGACSAPTGDGGAATETAPGGRQAATGADGTSSSKPVGAPDGSNAARAVESGGDPLMTADDGAAQGSEQPAPRGPLPLQRGVYVIAGSGCASPANAAIRIYNGSGLSGSSTRDCHATVRSHAGGRYEVDESCENTYDGTRTSEAQSIAVSDDRHFSLGGIGYVRCADGEASADLERLAR